MDHPALLRSSVQNRPHRPMMPHPEDAPITAGARAVGRRRGPAAAPATPAVEQMKVLVLGAGVIGVTAAYELAGAGHEVVVMDRQPGPGLETSFANAGEVSPGYSAPWAGPGVPLKAIKWLAMHHRPLVIRPNIDWSMIRWSLAMLRNCTAARYRINKARMVRLAEYSRDSLRALRAATGIAYDERMRGTMQLFRTQEQFDASASRHRRAARKRRRLRAARSRRLPPPRARARARAGEVRRRAAPARRRDRRLPSVHAAPRRARRQRGVDFRFETTIRADRPRRRPHHRRHDRQRRRRLPTPTSSHSAAIRRCCSRRSACASRSIRSRATRSPCRSAMRRRARVDGDGRDAQGRGDAARRPHPRRRHRRARRLHAAPARRAAAARSFTSSTISFPTAATSTAPSSGAASGR